jgi:hypothetical protein
MVSSVEQVRNDLGNYDTGIISLDLKMSEEGSKLQVVNTLEKLSNKVNFKRMVVSQSLSGSQATDELKPAGKTGGSDSKNSVWPGRPSV